MLKGRRSILDVSLPSAVPVAATTADAMRAYLSTLVFPTTTDAYEFPNLVLPANSKYAESLRVAGVKIDWIFAPKPDFLITNLEKSLVTLEEFTWNSTKRRLSRSDIIPGQKVLLEFPQGGRSLTCLVAASGTGKTRLLYEKCYAEFGAFIVAKIPTNGVGSADLSAFLGKLPQDKPVGEAVDRMRTQLIEHMNRILVARALVLLAAKAACPGLQPRHWLALQLYPGKFVKTSKENLSDVFSSVIASAHTVATETLIGHEWDASGIRFVALDEAQSADARYPNTFPSETLGQNKRSVLSPLLVALSTRPHVVMAGTGLGIESAYDTGMSSVGKHGTRPRLLGLTTKLEGDSLKQALRERGVHDADAVDPETLKLFAGRPRFAMRLAEALLLGTNPETTAAKAIVQDITNVLLPKLKIRPADTPEAPKTVYQEVRYAAQNWTLRGQGTVSKMGEVALEVGVCALDVQGVDMDSGLIGFVIKEPLVLRAFTDLRAADFEGVTNESDSELGIMLENYVALNADKVCAALSAANGLPETFQGPWILASPGGAELLGESCKDGEEPEAIRCILKNADTIGKSLVFPGTLMGADVVFAARRASDGRKLLVFIQAKASRNASAPMALKSLTLPYHTGRDKTPMLPKTFDKAYADLNAIIGDANTSVVFVVFKFPGKAVAKNIKVARYNPAGKEVLHMYLDERNAEEVLPGMKRGLKAIKGVKKRGRWALF